MTLPKALETPRYRLANSFVYCRKVRAVQFPRQDLVISASRDCSVRSWLRQSTSPPIFEPTVISQGSDFINSLTYIPPSRQYPDGLIASGGRDTIIDVRAPSATPSDNAERLLIGHAHNVCTLAVSPEGSYLVSGGWDGQARVWSIGKWETEVTLDGHDGKSVWAVLALDENTVVTGCADSNIRIFDLRKRIAGIVQPTSTIYTSDVIRALCMVPRTHSSGADIASASNDGVIRLWKLNGQLVRELHGHESFIYALSTLPTGELVSAGEDRTVRVWSGSDCIQTITHPAISVWTVAVCQETGDIATGDSHGIVRIFSRAADRIASEEAIQQFEETIKASAIPQQQMGDINKEKLPGPEFLTTRSGTKEGQVQMIKQPDGSITAHQWSMSKSDLLRT
jgi:phospholipase A-2-activating protein